MKRHHILMIERDKRGDIIAGHEVPNNEWARCRRKGWEFATPEETAAYQKMQAEALSEKNARKDELTISDSKADGGSIRPGQGGWYTVTLGDRVEKAQGEEAAKALLASMVDEAAAAAKE